MIKHEIKGHTAFLTAATSLPFSDASSGAP